MILSHHYLLGAPTAGRTSTNIQSNAHHHLLSVPGPSLPPLAAPPANLREIPCSVPKISVWCACIDPPNSQRMFSARLLFVLSRTLTGRWNDVSVLGRRFEQPVVDRIAGTRRYSASGSYQMGEEVRLRGNPLLNVLALATGPALMKSPCQL